LYCWSPLILKARPFNIEGLKPFYIEGKTLKHWQRYTFDMLSAVWSATPRFLLQVISRVIRTCPVPSTCYQPYDPQFTTLYLLHVISRMIRTSPICFSGDQACDPLLRDTFYRLSAVWSATYNVVHFTANRLYDPHRPDTSHRLSAVGSATYMTNQRTHYCPVTDQMASNHILKGMLLPPSPCTSMFL
jgi:hypothetical protein